MMYLGALQTSDWPREKFLVNSWLNEHEVVIKSKLIGMMTVKTCGFMEVNKIGLQIDLLLYDAVIRTS